MPDPTTLRQQFRVAYRRGTTQGFYIVSLFCASAAVVICLAGENNLLAAVYGVGGVVLYGIAEILRELRTWG